MRTASLVIVSLLCTFNTAAAMQPASTDCSFSEDFAMRSGKLPYAGTLDEQVAASVDTIYTFSTQSKISYMYKIGGKPSVRIVAKEDDKRIREYHYVNAGQHSYQFNLSATPAMYSKQKKNLRALLRDPFGKQEIRCN